MLNGYVFITLLHWYIDGYQVMMLWDKEVKSEKVKELRGYVQITGYGVKEPLSKSSNPKLLHRFIITLINPIFKFSNHQIFKLLHCYIEQLLHLIHYPIFKLTNFQIFKLFNAHCPLLKRFYMDQHMI